VGIETMNGRRLPSVLLVVSLAINLFVVGAVASALVLDRCWLPFATECQPTVNSFAMPRPSHIRAAVDDEAAAVLDATLEPHRPVFRERFRALMAARAAVAEAVKAEPFDAEALLATLDDLRERERAVSEIAQITLVDLAARMDPEARERIAELMTKRTRAPMKRRDEAP